MCYYDFKSSVYHIYMVIRSVAICWRPPMWPTRWPELLPAPTAVWTPSSTSWLGRTSAVTSPRRASCLNWKKQMWATVWQRSSDAIPQTTLAKKCKRLRGQVLRFMPVSSGRCETPCKLQESRQCLFSKKTGLLRAGLPLWRRKCEIKTRETLYVSTVEHTTFRFASLTSRSTCCDVNRCKDQIWAVVMKVRNKHVNHVVLSWFVFFFSSVLVKESTGQKLHPMFVCIATSGFSSALLSVSHKSDKVDTRSAPPLAFKACFECPCVICAYVRKCEGIKRSIIININNFWQNGCGDSFIICLMCHTAFL